MWNITDGSHVPYSSMNRHNYLHCCKSLLEPYNKKTSSSPPPQPTTTLLPSGGREVWKPSIPPGPCNTWNHRYGINDCFHQPPNSLILCILTITKRLKNHPPKAVIVPKLPIHDMSCVTTIMRRMKNKTKEILKNVGLNNNKKIVTGNNNGSSPTRAIAVSVFICHG
jgi:hypothetical protein